MESGVNEMKSILASTAALGLFLLSACSNSTSVQGAPGPQPPPFFKTMPDQIQIDASQLTPVSDTEAAHGMDIFAKLMAAHTLQRQILISSGESSKEKGAREAALKQMTAVQKDAVTTMRAHCSVSENPGIHRSSLTFHQKIQTAGAHCPADLGRETSLTYTVLESDDLGKNGLVGMSGNTNLHQQYRDAGLAKAAGAQGFIFQAMYQGLSKITPNGSKIYFKISGQGSTESLDLGSVTMSLKAESLGTESDRVLIYYIDVTAGGHNYTFAARANASADQIEIVEFYIGDHKLSDKDAASAGAEDLIRQL